jgi:tetratricopeptide (TPR) repeat protein
MKALIPEEEVNRYLDIGFAHLDPDDESEEMIRLLMGRSMVLFSRWQEGDDVPDRPAQARELGQRAVEIATGMGRVDLASAALDAVGSVETTLGDYRANTRVLEQRLPMMENLRNPWEVGDAFAMAAWNYSYIGDYQKARDLAAEGVTRSGDDAPGIELHITAWLSYCEFWLGDWEVVVNNFAPRARLILGERAAEPPYFTGHQFGVEAFIHTARRDDEMAESRGLLTRMVDRAEATVGPLGGLMFKAWEAWIRAREGDTVEAMSRLRPLSTQALVRPHVDIVIASAMLDGGLYSDAEEFIADSRSYAEWAGIDALPPHLDRLEAAGLLANGDSEPAINLLGKALAGFENLEVPWEVARTQLWLADAYLATSNREGAANAIAAAQPILESLGSLNEIERARSLLAQL